MINKQINLVRFKHPITISGILCIILAASIFSIAYGSPSKKEKEVYAYHDLFLSVYEKIVNYYVEETSRTVLLEGALKGMLETLDRNNFYIVPEKKDTDIVSEARGNTFGLILGIKDSKLLVIRALPGSSAEAAGLQSGDWIWSLGDKIMGTTPSLIDAYKILLLSEDETFYSSEDETVNVTDPLDEGDQGNSDKAQTLRMTEEQSLDEEKSPQQGLKVTYLRGKKAEKVNRKVMSLNGTTTIPSAQSVILSHKPEALYLRPEYIKTVADYEMLLKSTSGIQSPPDLPLILDLRQNVSLSPELGCKIAALYLPAHKLITKLRYYNEKSVHPINTEVNGPYAGTAMIILVDEGTAGGAEILAAALNFHKAALTVGAKTFGFAYARVNLPVSTGGLMSIIGGEYSSPDSKDLYAEGFTPDFLTEQTLTPGEWQKMSIDQLMKDDSVMKVALLKIKDTRDLAHKATPN